MNYRQVMAEKRRLERAGWCDVQIRAEGEGWRRSYGLTAVDPQTGYTSAPVWATLAEREGGPRRADR